MANSIAIIVSLLHKTGIIIRDVCIFISKRNAVLGGTTKQSNTCFDNRFWWTPVIFRPYAKVIDRTIALQTCLRKTLYLNSVFNQTRISKFTLVADTRFPIFDLPQHGMRATHSQCLDTRFPIFGLPQHWMRATHSQGFEHAVFKDESYTFEVDEVVHNVSAVDHY